MAKIVLSDIASGFDLSKINSNFTKIADDLNDKVLYRNNLVGEPNALESDIDVNGKKLYNLPEPILMNQAARLRDVRNGITGSHANLIEFTPYKNLGSDTVQGAIQEEIDDLESGIGSSFIGHSYIATAVRGTIQSEITDRGINIKGIPYLAFGDGVTDDTIAINAANVAATALEKMLWFPSGTYIASNIPAIARMNWMGESEFNTVIKLKSGTNAGLVTSTTSDIDNISIQRMRFDGNSAGNTSGDTLTIKGLRTILRDVTVINSAGTGITTDWIQVNAGNPLGCDGHFEHIIIDSSKGSGWIHNGPSDSNFNDVVIIDAGLKADNTYIGFIMNSGGRFTDLHTWNRWNTTNTPSVSVYVNCTGANFFGCNFEGGHTPLSVAGNGNSFSACNYYAPREAYTVSLTGTANRLDGIFGLGAFGGNLNFKGIYLGGAGNTIDITDIGCLNGAIDFSGSLGNNIVRLGGYRSSGTLIVGTPHATDDVEVNVGGPSGASVNLDTAWTAYTPTITAGAGAFTTAIGTGRYKQKGKTVTGNVTISVTTVGTASFSTQFTLPVTAKGAIGQVSGREGTVGTLLLGFLASTTIGSVQKYDSTFIGASGTSLQVNFTYEAA